MEVHWSGMAQRRFEFHGKRKTEDMTVAHQPLVLAAWASTVPAEGSGP
ncbi:MAG: hypothetical protein R3F17_15865 [Planctomycetota bacterium]